MTKQDTWQTYCSCSRSNVNWSQSFELHTKTPFLIIALPLVISWSLWAQCLLSSEICVHHDLLNCLCEAGYVYTSAFNNTRVRDAGPLCKLKPMYICYASKNIATSTNSWLTQKVGGGERTVLAIRVFFHNVDNTVVSNTELCIMGLKGPYDTLIQQLN